MLRNSLGNDEAELNALLESIAEGVGKLGEIEKEVATAKVIFLIEGLTAYLLNWWMSDIAKMESIIRFLVCLSV